MSYTNGNPGDVQLANTFFKSSLEAIRKEIFEVLYDPLTWSAIVPPESIVQEFMAPGVRQASYIVEDYRGQGTFNTDMASNTGTVDFSFDKVTAPVQEGHLAYRFSNSEAVAYARGMNMIGAVESFSDRMMKSMLKAMDKHIESVFFFGAATQGYESFLDYPGVPTSTVPNGAGGFPEWSTKTSEEIIDDIQSALGSIYENSRGLFVPNTVIIPLAQYSLLTSKLVSTAGNVSVATYIQQNNVYTSQSGLPLKFIPTVRMQGSGAGDSDRMRVILQETDQFMFAAPIESTFDLLAPQYVGYDTHVYAKYNLGSCMLPYAISQVNFDGI